MLLWLVGAASAGEISCAREGGVAAGAFDGRRTWEHAGSASTWVATGSPELAMRCDAALGPVFAIAGAETAPFYDELVGLRHAEPVYLTGTVGLGVGVDEVRVAGVVTGFVQTFGVGGSVELLPFAVRGQPYRMGFDLRGIAYPIGGPGYQGQLLFVVTTLRAGGRPRG